MHFCIYTRIKEYKSKKRDKTSENKEKEGFLRRLTFVGATHEVTGSCYFLEAAGKKFLVDCGMEQGPDNF